MFAKPIKLKLIAMILSKCKHLCYCDILTLYQATLLVYDILT